MGFVDVLRKLGIFRSGATAQTYKNAKDRKLQLQDDDIYNEEKDVLIKKK